MILFRNRINKEINKRIANSWKNFCAHIIVFLSKMRILTKIIIFKQNIILSLTYSAKNIVTNNHILVQQNINEHIFEIKKHSKNLIQNTLV